MLNSLVSSVATPSSTTVSVQTDNVCVDETYEINNWFAGADSQTSAMFNESVTVASMSTSGLSFLFSNTQLKIKCGIIVRIQFPRRTPSR